MDAITLLEKDHRKVEDLFGTFTKAGSDDERRSTAATLIKELSIHSEIEKLHLYPTLRNEVQGGEKYAEHSLEEHQKVEEIAAKLEKMIDKANTKQFAHDVERLQRDVMAHVKEEETEIFPMLREALTKTRLNEIGTEMNKAKSKVPTHPHPSSPNEGVAHEVMGKAAGVVDRARDKVSGR